MNSYSNSYSNSLLYAPNGRMPQFSFPGAAPRPPPDSHLPFSDEFSPPPPPSALNFQPFIPLLLKLLNTLIDQFSPLLQNFGILDIIQSILQIAQVQ